MKKKILLLGLLMAGLVLANAQVLLPPQQAFMRNHR